IREEPSIILLPKAFLEGNYCQKQGGVTMLNRLQLRPKLMLLFILVGLIPVLIAAIISYRAAAEELNDQINKRIQLFVAEKAAVFDYWFVTHRQAAHVFATSREIYESMNLYY